MKPPCRAHVRFYYDQALAQTIRGAHLIEIRGVGEAKRYERAMVHFEKAEESLRLAVAVVQLLKRQFDETSSSRGRVADNPIAVASTASPPAP